ncbi:ATP-dependent Lon protease [Tenacibaculum maritimum]|nr:ATP-dependent Lon protease [Tenacibaculum maritimum]
MEIIRNEITVSQKHLKTLREEFKTSRQTVFNALKDFTQSTLAKDIRKRAKELLLAEANQIKVEE